MRAGLILILTCGIALVGGRTGAAEGPLLFEGPPPPQANESKVALTAHQGVGGSPFQIEELPPAPVPIDEPTAEDEQHAEPNIMFGDETNPFEADVFVVPPGLPSESEAPSAPAATSEPPPSESLRAPLPPGADDEATSEPAADAPRLVPLESTLWDDAHSGNYYQDRPAGSGGNCRPWTGCFRMPNLSCADLALPELGQPEVFDEFGLDLGGWLEAGFSVAGTSPADRFNGPVTFNDRHAEAQMNQLWMYLERKPCTWACSLDLGGRIDVLYGTDAEFIQARDGLEANWDQTERFYQMALPQFYLDATYAGWTVRMGKFFTVLGHETPAAPDNFFYSHAYTIQYGEPFTHMGMLVSRRFGNWLVNAGFHRGNDQFDDTDGLDALNLLGGVGYTAPGDWATVEYALSSTENGPGVQSYTHSLVNTVRMTRRLDYVLQGDYGQIWNGRLRRKISWWGLNQYLVYTLNPCWAGAIRFEWFRDRDGGRVSGIRAGNQTPTGLAGDFYAITLGLNWTPRTNLRVRPELRWDIFDPHRSTSNQAYDAGNVNHQFLFGCDVVYRF